jgi:quercetin dioxygenase-like cupin family protein
VAGAGSQGLERVPNVHRRCVQRADVPDAADADDGPMTASQPSFGDPADEIIVNPASGERIRIRPTPEGGNRDVLVWDLWLAPGGRVPSGHVHPGQSETFHVQQGQLRFRLGLFSRAVVGPGESLRVPPGRPHHFASVGDTQVHALVETTPAREMAALLRVAAGLAGDDRGGARALPRPIDLLLFMDEFRDEVQAPYVPSALMRVVLMPLVVIIRRLGLDGSYRRLRASSSSNRRNASR